MSVFRLLSLVPLVSGLCLWSSCKKNDAAEAGTPTAAFDPLRLVPAASTTVGGVHLSEIVTTQLWKNSEQMVKEQGKDMLEGMSACNLGLDKWTSITVGFDPAGGDGTMAAVIVADGVGRKETLDCAAGKIKEKSGKDAWTAEEGGKVLKMEQGRVAYVVDDDTIVVAAKDWADSVKALTKGEGKSAVDGALADVIGRTDPGKHVWFAGTLADEAKAMAKSMAEIGEPQDVAGWMDLSGGMELWVAVGLKDAAQAAKAKDTIQTQFDGMKAMAGQFGVPQGVVDSVKFDTKGSALTVTANVSDAELQAIQEQVVGSMMGGM